MRCSHFFDYIVRKLDFVSFRIITYLLCLFFAYERRFREEERVFDPKSAWFMYSPRPLNLICVGESYITAFMVSKVEVIVPERVFHPIWYTDGRRALYVIPNAAI